MYKLAYAHEVDEAPGTSRERERRAFDRSIELLELAEKEGVRSQQSIEAVLYTRRLWALLLEDLARENNALPEQLRASLLSVGLWVLKECEEIRMRRSTNYRAVIEVSQTIRDGLA